MEKTCSTCREIKSTFDFHKHVRMPDGLCSSCKNCRNKKARQDTFIRQDEIKKRVFVDLLGEVWKPVRGFEGHYEVSNKGRVRNVKTKINILTLFTDRSGYKIATLGYKKKQKFCRVNRLVAQAFLPNPSEYKEVNHINSKKHDNCLENLEWVNQRENRTHYLITNKIKKTSRFTGVSYHKRNKAWYACIRVLDQSIHLGKFSNENDACSAYQDALIKYKVTNRYSIK